MTDTYDFMQRGYFSEPQKTDTVREVMRENSELPDQPEEGEYDLLDF